jgi:hypothetical protein
MRAHPLFLLLLVPALAHAQPKTGDAISQREADQRFAEGKESYRLRHFSEALVKFTQACAADKTERCPLNLGVTELELKMYPEATQHFGEYLRSKEIPKSDPSVPRIQKLYDECFAKSGHVEISAPDGADVFVDDKNVGKAPLASVVHVKSGPHALRAVLADGRFVTESSTAVDGQVTRVTLSIAPATTNTAPPLPPSGLGSGDTVPPVIPPDNGPGPARIVTVAALGVGAVASFALSIGFHGSATSAKDKVDGYGAQYGTSACGGGSVGGAPCADWRDAKDTASSAGTLSAVFVVSGIVLSAAALATFLLWPGTKSGRPTAWVAPSVGGVSGGVIF